MKYKYKIISLVLFLTISFSNIVAQLTNTSFENWVNGEPVDWFTLDVPGIADAVTQTSDSHTGSSAARLETATWLNLPFPPSLQAGQLGSGIAISNKPTAITGYYKQSPLGGDVLAVTVLVSKDQALIGAASGKFGGSMSSFAQFTIPITYINSEIPNEATVSFAILDTTSGISTVGSWAIVDDVELTDAITDVTELNLTPTEYSLVQNYPNPFNPTTTINFSIPESDYVKMTVHNLIGEEVSRLVNSQLSAGNHQVQFDGSNLSSGVYFYKLETAKFSSVKKLMLAK